MMGEMDHRKGSATLQVRNAEMHDCSRKTQILICTAGKVLVPEALAVTSLMDSKEG